MRDERSGTPELRARGEGIAAIEREHINLDSRREAHAGKIKTLARQQGLHIEPAKVRNPARVAENLRIAADLEETIRRQEAAEAANREEQNQ